ncbi:MAG TPA: hypothetical protein DD388_01505, partial [Acidimicrobiaceae bacterium]|nr:hypothetical protein [Acidimicrobiaceae bacterium]
DPDTRQCVPVAGGPVGSLSIMSDLQSRIEELWANRESLNPDDADANAAIHEAIELLDRGEARVAEPGPDGVVVNEWLKL